MKSIFSILIIVGMLYLPKELIAQYSLTNSYLVDPNLVIGHVDSCAQFWLPTYDNENGGFYENVSRNGNVSGTSKTMLGQTRTAYGMIKTFMLTGDTSYLGYARGALDFMYDHAWDNVNMGWYNELNKDGSIISSGDHNDDKWSFMQHYALLGIAAMVEATDNKLDWQYLNNGRLAVDSLLWDGRTEYLGYFNEANLDWSNKRGKGFTPTADAITTHGLSMYLLTRTNDRKERLIILANNLSDYLVGNMDKFNYGFPESYNNNWEPNLNDTFVFTGHLLKAAWCMTRAYLIQADEKLLEGSTTLLNHVLEYGYDDVNGGCYSNFNGSTGIRYNSNKEWWQLEQAFTAAIMNYYISKDDRFLLMADETIDFYMSYMADHKYGEVYTSTSESGSIVNSNKASYWKAGYHSIELGYYIYLYSNLYIHNEPVKLYYHFKPVSENREIVLTPLAIEDDMLEIKSVKLNEEDYQNYLGDSRTLQIPQNEGGLFEVTFGRKEPTSVVKNSFPEDFKLYQNYPNPFNPTTVIEYYISENSFINLDVYNILGEKVRSLVNEFKHSGHHSAVWNGKSETGESLAGGVYFIKVKNENNIQTIKSILLK